MIKFFRKIRQRLISEGKTSKYLKYAFGEIILVMIGILLALQVNNWNEDRKNKQVKSVYIERLINDLKSDTTAFSFNIKNAQIKADDGKFAISAINTNDLIINNKTFILRLQNVGRVFVHSKSSNTFLDLQSTGNLKLFEEDTVVDALRNYYFNANEFWYSIYVDRTAEGLLPIITDLFPFRIGEEIINSEIKTSPNTTPGLNHDNYDISVSDDDVQLILEKIKRHPDFNFHLKNATRAHLLQIRVQNDNYKEASDLIKMLNRIYK
ncbi:MAG: DUF6090 family protein [bacterium]